jgi:ankyrin repeat protein
MKFLVINDNKNLSSKIEEKIIDNNIKNKCFCCNFSVEDIKQHLKEFKSLGFCIILNEKPDNIDKTILSFLHELKGYLFAENIIIITNIESLKSQSLTNSSNINYISSPDEIINFLDKKTDKILSAAKKRLAKKKLLDKGIPYTKDCFATYIAKNKPLIFDEFIEAGMDINSRDDLGTPILNVACRNDNFDFVTKILDLGADINASSTDRGYTAIMDAVWRGNEKIASYLIQHGAELNTINKEGQNNLILAVGANRYNICKLLVENGSNPDVKDQMGMSAYNYACLFKKISISELLKPYHKE